MDNSISNQKTSDNNMDTRNMTIILLLVVIIVFSSLGMFFVKSLAVFYKLVSALTDKLLYTLGFTIGKTSDLVSQSGEKTLDIANGAVHNGSDLMMKAGKEENSPTKKKEEPSPDDSANPIQKPITSAKANWCLVGEYQGRRGCIEVDDNDKCLSGQVFPSQYTCLNPNFSQNVLPNLPTPSGIPPRMNLYQLPYYPAVGSQVVVHPQVVAPTVLYNQDYRQGVVSDAQNYRKGVVSDAQNYRQDTVSDAQDYRQDTASERKDYRQDTSSERQDRRKDNQQKRQENRE